MDSSVLLFITFNVIQSISAWPHETRRTNNWQPRDIFFRRLQDDPSKNQFHDRHQESLAPRGGADDDEIVFPPTSSNEFKETFENKQTFSVVGKDFGCIYGLCDYAVDYPTKRIQKIIDSIPRSADLFGHLQGNVVDTGTKTADVIKTSLCTSNTYVKFPEKGINAIGIETFIVNQEGYKQGVVITVCSNRTENTGQCNNVASFHTGFERECVQEFAKILLFAVGEDNVLLNEFLIPSCCICKFRAIKN